MTNYNTILFAALGGAIIGGLIAAFVGTNKDEQFPLSPSTGLNDDFSDSNSDYSNSELGSRPEMREVFQQS